MPKEFIKTELAKRLFHKFETSISLVLTLLMGIVVISSTLELIVILYKNITKPPSFFLNLSELFEVFGLFMMVIIAFELMASIYMYSINKNRYVEMMFLIAITAVTRKIVILDSKVTDPVTLIGIAAILVALIAGFYVMKISHDKPEKITT